MTTFFVTCFIAGLGLSVVSFVSGLEHVNVFDSIFHGHRAIHLPRPGRGVRSRSSFRHSPSGSDPRRIRSTLNCVELRP